MLIPQGFRYTFLNYFARGILQSFSVDYVPFRLHRTLEIETLSMTLYHQQNLSQNELEKKQFCCNNFKSPYKILGAFNSYFWFNASAFRVFIHSTESFECRYNSRTPGKEWRFSTSAVMFYHFFCCFFFNEMGEYFIRSLQLAKQNDVRHYQLTARAVPTYFPSDERTL